MESLDRVLYHTNPIMDLKRSSSYSYLSETSFLPSEVKSCKSEALADRYGTSCRKQAVSSPFEIFMPIELQTTKSPNHLEPRHDYAETDVSLDLTAARTSDGTTKSHLVSLLRSLDGNPGAKTRMNTLHALYFAKENGGTTKIPLFGNNLFSCSLPEQYNRKVEISSRNTPIDHSLDTVPRDNNEEEHYISLEEIEAQTIGNLLPDDDDLFGGVIDGLDCVMQPNGGDMEEMELFYNVGGMDLEDCDFSKGQKNVNSGTNGLTGRKQTTSKKAINQGILIVSNVDSSVSNDNLHNIFCTYGDIKEIQSVPQCNHQRLIEYFDTRAAEAALHALNGSKIAGKQIKLEPVTYGGIKDLLKHSFALQIPYLGSLLQNRISSTVHDQNSLPSLDNKTDHSTGQLKFDTWGSPNFHPHSLGDYHDAFMNGFQTSSNISKQLHKFTSNGHSPEQGVFRSAVNGSSPPNGRESIWSNSCNSHPPGTMWPNSLSYMNGGHGFPSPMQLASNNHHVGSAPTVSPTIWDRHQAYAAAGSPETSVFHPASWGSTRISKTPLHSVGFVPHNMYPHVSGNCMDLPMPSTSVVGFHSSPHQRCMMFPGRDQRLPGLCSYDPPSERVRSRRSEGASSNQALADKKQFELDIERIIRGEDSRTTLMIKNIPNKYTSKMLLAAIDENHRGTYDFIYLPIDFKNKCNVGYAFINMTEPSQIIPFYKAFNGKKWEKFNSEKVASLAYARIQGKSALISHFQNSSLMNEDKRCRPILFNTEGPNAGDQVPFPMGINGRSRVGKTRSVSLEEKNNMEAIEGDHSSKRRGGGGEESTSYSARD